FLPAKAKARADAIAEIASLRASLVLYESGPRLGHTLAALAQTLAERERGARLGDTLAALEQQLGDRESAVAREISKLHEECVTGTLAGLAARYSDAAPKGDTVFAVGPPAAEAEASDADVDAALDEALGRTSLSRAAA